MITAAGCSRSPAKISAEAKHQSAPTSAATSTNPARSKSEPSRGKARANGSIPITKVPTLNDEQGDMATRYCLDLATLLENPSAQDAIDDCMLNFLQPFSKQTGMQKATLQQATKQWTYSPILTTNNPPSGLTNQSIYTRTLGKQTEVLNELYIIQHNPTTAPTSNNYQDSINKGAIWLTLRHIDKTEPRRQHDFGPDRTTTGLDQEIRVYEQTIKEDGRNHLSLRWDNITSTGITRYEVSANPTQHTEAELAQYINTLQTT